MFNHFKTGFVFGSKAETLENLNGKLLLSKIPIFIYFSSSEWKSNKASILKRIENGQQGYEEISGRYASFYLGHISKTRGQKEDAIKYFHQVIDFTEDLVDEEDSGYYLYAEYYLAEYEVEAGDYDKALERIDIIRDNTKRKESLNEKARDLKKLIRKRT